jgi:site-specific DNA-methyltransferase (adenine-specific)
LRLRKPERQKAVSQFFTECQIHNKLSQLQGVSMRQKQIGNTLLIHGDAFLVMPTLGDVDVLITDPPYNAKTHKGARSAKSLGASQIDFAGISEQQFVEFCASAVAQTKRWVVMSCAWQHAAELEKAGIPLVRLGVWTKKNAAPQFTGDRPGVGWEAVAILHREGRKRWNGGGHHAVWACNVEHGEHPTQKPLPLLMDWVSKFTDPGESRSRPILRKRHYGPCVLKTWAQLHRNREGRKVFRPRLQAPD